MTGGPVAASPSRADISCEPTLARGGADPEILAMLPGLTKIAGVGAATDMFGPAELPRRRITLEPASDVITVGTGDCAVSPVVAILRKAIAEIRRLPGSGQEPVTSGE